MVLTLDCTPYIFLSMKPYLCKAEFLAVSVIKGNTVQKIEQEMRVAVYNWILRLLRSALQAHTSHQ